jgi:TRAP-type C4-dicarboxylate transport system permease small subunit
VETSLFGRALRWLSLAAGWVLVLLLGYTVLDVALRYFFNAPFRGSLEFTQFLMALIVFLGLAYCGWTGGHVAVDILERPLSGRRGRFIGVFLALISAALFAAIAWFTVEEAIATQRRLSNMMRWPYWPFLLVAALGSAVYAATLLVQGLRKTPTTRQGPSGA